MNSPEGTEVSELVVSPTPSSDVPQQLVGIQQDTVSEVADLVDSTDPFELFERVDSEQYQVVGEHATLDAHFGIVPGVVGVELLVTHFGIQDIFESGARVSFKKPMYPGDTVQCRESERGYQLFNPETEEVITEIEARLKNIATAIEPSLGSSSVDIQRETILDALPQGKEFNFIDSAVVDEGRRVMASAAVPHSMPNSSCSIESGNVPVSFLLEIVAQGASIPVLTMPERKNWRVFFTGAHTVVSPRGLSLLGPGDSLVVFSERTRKRDTGNFTILSCDALVYRVGEESGEKNFDTYRRFVLRYTAAE